MAISDGGASITGSPLLITGGSGTTWSVAGNYYPSISNDSTMVASFSTVVPGEYIQNSSITNPVKVVGYQTGAIGQTGNYTLSTQPNTAGTVGSSGSPVVFTGTTITDGGAIAPGPALTIKDLGPGITFPLNLPISSSVGAITASGTYDTASLGGTPSAIQAQVSLTANGAPISGCSACAWTNLASYTATPYTFTASITTGGAMTVTSEAKPAIGNAFTGARIQRHDHRKHRSWRLYRKPRAGVCGRLGDDDRDHGPQLDWPCGQYSRRRTLFCFRPRRERDRLRDTPELGQGWAHLRPLWPGAGGFDAVHTVGELYFVVSWPMGHCGVGDHILERS